MIVWLVAIALLFVLIYFLCLGRRRDDIRRFGNRYRERRRDPAPDQSIHPNPQFDLPPADVER